MTYSKLLRKGLLVFTVFGLLGCLERGDKRKSVAGATAASGNALSALRSDTGIVEGVVIMEGDPAATQSDLERRVPKECPDAMKTYGLVFREGPGRKAADVFVAVTGYQGNPGEKSGDVPVIGRGCTWDKRTYGMTANQRLMVRSADERPYAPKLLNNGTTVTLIAVPGGEAMPVRPIKGLGLYVLYDEMRYFTQATVMVWKNSTFDVTGLDGRFRIEGVPVGASKVSAFLPTADVTVEQPITVTKNATVRVELKLRFDAAAYALKMANTAAPAAASGARAAASAAPAAPVQPPK